MTLHLYMQHKCTECETIYIPYNNTVPCPKCGDQAKMENYPDLINGICESFLYNIREYGNFIPMCWITMDISDSLQVFLFGIFHKWVLEESSNHEPHMRTAAFKEFIKNIIKEIDFNELDFMENYIHDLTLAIYNEFFNIRNINLKITEEKKVKIKND